MALTYAVCDLKVDPDIKGLINEIIAEDEKLEPIRCLTIGYIFRSKFKKNSEKMPILATTKICSAKDHAKNGEDVEIEIAEDVWMACTREQKKRILWHELKHIVVEMDPKTKEPMYKASGRISVKLRPHDLVMASFLEEIHTFGPTESQMGLFKSIGTIMRRVKKGELSVQMDFPMPDPDGD